MAEIESTRKFIYQVDKPLLKAMIDFLGPFAKYFDQLEKSDEPGFHKVVPVYYSIQKGLNPVVNGENPVKNYDDVMVQIKEFFKISLQKTFKPALTNDHYLATFLDPRFKSFKFLNKNERALKLAEIRNMIISQSPIDMPDTNQKLSTKVKRQKLSLYDFSESSSEEEDLTSGIVKELSDFTSTKFEEDYMEFWKKYHTRFPLMFVFFKQTVILNSSESLSERIFSTSGQFNTKIRSSLGINKLAALTTSKSALINNLLR